MINEMGIRVERIPAKEGKKFIIEHHYTHGCHGAPTTFGAFHGGQLVAVAAFATPCSEAVRAWPFGKGDVDAVTELHRLFMLPVETWTERPPNALSWFGTRVGELLPHEKPKLRAFVSFADSTEGHMGGIYRAMNLLYFGPVGKKTKAYFDPVTKRLHHSRQCGHNLTTAEAAERGWVPVIRGLKHKYLGLVGSRTEKYDAMNRLLHTPIKWDKAT